MSKVTSLIKGEVRIYVADATEVAQVAIAKHNTEPLASLALATGVAVFGTFGTMKKGLKTSVNVKGNGPLKNIIVETDGEGHLRALVGNPYIKTEVDNGDINSIPLTLGIGDGGTIKVVHLTDQINFGGEVALANGDITTDLAYYLDQSEQINSAVLSSIVLEAKDKIKHAKAVIFQMLPKHDERDVRWVESFVKENKLGDMSIEEYIKKIDGQVLEEQTLEWKCTCSEDKMKDVALTLSIKDREELIEEFGFVEVTCNFCNEKYQFKDL